MDRRSLYSIEDLKHLSEDVDEFFDREILVYKDTNKIVAEKNPFITIQEDEDRPSYIKMTVGGLVTMTTFDIFLSVYMYKKESSYIIFSNSNTSITVNVW